MRISSTSDCKTRLIAPAHVGDLVQVFTRSLVRFQNFVEKFHLLVRLLGIFVGSEMGKTSKKIPKRGMYKEPLLTRRWFLLTSTLKRDVILNVIIILFKVLCQSVFWFVLDPSIQWYWHVSILTSEQNVFYRLKWHAVFLNATNCGGLLRFGYLLCILCQSDVLP